jgi:hypothetical protein
MESSAREREKRKSQGDTKTKKIFIDHPAVRVRKPTCKCATARDLEDMLFENFIVELLRVTDLT